MAAGEQVSLKHRTFMNAGKTAVAQEGTPDAAWFLGDEGTIVDKDYAVALGLTEEDFGEVQSGMAAYLAQEKRNREAAALTSATIVQPGPAMTATTPARQTVHRETGDALVDPNLSQGANLVPQSLQQPHQTPDLQAERQAGRVPDADKQAEDSDKDSAEDTASTSPSTGGATRARSAPETRAKTPDETR